MASRNTGPVTTAARTRLGSLRAAVDLDRTVAWPRRVMAVVWLPLILAATLLGSGPHPGPVAAWTGSVLAAVGWVGMAFRVVRPAWVAPAVSLLLAAGGLVLLYGAGGWSTAAAFPFLGVHMAGFRMPLRRALPLAVLVAAGMTLVIVPGETVWDVTVIVVSTAAALLLGLVRRDAARRHEEREHSLVADARAREEHARADAIAERARIARDVHDVLAHSLSALAVQLQGARLMALRDGAAPDTIAQIERAQGLATEGLTEARRAVRALRDGPAPVDVAEGLRSLIADHPGATAEIDDDCGAVLDPRQGETLLRTAQEALTNVRKHAPGAAVRVRLRRDGDGAELEVVDGGSGGSTAAPLGPSQTHGHGYGLVGMAERAELIGARLEAGPADGGWRVALRVPAAADGDGQDRDAAPGGARPEGEDA